MSRQAQNGRDSMYVEALKARSSSRKLVRARARVSVSPSPPGPSKSTPLDWLPELRDRTEGSRVSPLLERKCDAYVCLCLCGVLSWCCALSPKRRYFCEIMVVIIGEFLI